MTVMDVEIENSETEGGDSNTERDRIIDFLTSNDAICFKSQQMGENDLSKHEKTAIASELFDKSKLNFLTKFGRFLRSDQLNYFRRLADDDCPNSYELGLVLKGLEAAQNQQQIVRNRRYEALKQMIAADQYFSEIEMMKRNPLLYEQLVGQFLTEDEKKVRDRIEIDNQSTFVKILMEGIERGDAKIKQQEQENEEEDDSDDDSGEARPTHTQWGEFHDARPPKRRSKPKFVTAPEQKLLKEEFITSMYQSFLDGKDEDFDYNQVDNNDKFDDVETIDHDEEDKYFDSEEPELVAAEQEEQVESEDELDIYMSALNQNPIVTQLSEDIKKM